MAHTSKSLSIVTLHTKYPSMPSISMNLQPLNKKRVLSHEKSMPSLSVMTEHGRSDAKRQRNNQEHKSNQDPSIVIAEKPSAPKPAVADRWATKTDTVATPAETVASDEDPTDNADESPVKAPKPPFGTPGLCFPLPHNVEDPNGWTSSTYGTGNLLESFPYEFDVGGKVAFVALQSPGTIALVECRGYFYIWDLVSYDVFRIVEPAHDIDEILKRLSMSENYCWDVKLEEVEERQVPGACWSVVAPENWITIK